MLQMDKQHCILTVAGRIHPRSHPWSHMVGDLNTSSTLGHLLLLCPHQSLYIRTNEDEERQLSARIFRRGFWVEKISVAASHLFSVICESLWCSTTTQCVSVWRSWSSSPSKHVQASLLCQSMRLSSLWSAPAVVTPSLQWYIINQSSQIIRYSPFLLISFYPLENLNLFLLNLHQLLEERCPKVL